jgi:hypothetical protein
MTLRRAGLRHPISVKDLRAFIRTIDTVGSAIPSIAEQSSALAQPSLDDQLSHTTVVGRRPDTLDPTWLDDWSGIYLGDSETQSLGHKFFTQTTPDQEQTLNNPRGVTFVEGIAGAGKTSVALGRLKFFANFATGENREHYGLQMAAESDFSPAGMTGFVLSHSLKRYLKETAIELDLERLPIRDFPEFRTHLSNQFGLTQAFKRSRAEAPALRTRLAWLRAVDAALARAAGLKLQDAASKTPGIAESVREAILRFSQVLISAKPQPDDATFHLNELARRLVDDVMKVEFRAREAAIRDKMNKEKFTLELQRELVRVQEDEERGAVSPLVRRLLGLLATHDLFISAVQDEGFRALIQQAFANPIDADIVKALDVTITDLRTLLSKREENGRRSLRSAELRCCAFLRKN